ncbi:MAG: hypothetical protein IMW92_12505 [Bacillales bacterium]|nr:hypothetical protein [Bacillales bacterium]
MNKKALMAAAVSFGLLTAPLASKANAATFSTNNDENYKIQCQYDVKQFPISQKWLDNWMNQQYQYALSIAKQASQAQPHTAVTAKSAPSTPAAKANKTVAQPTNTKAPAASKTGYSLKAYEQQVVDLTNKERAKYGLPPLKIDPTLSKMAREKANDMAVHHYFSHTSPTYGSPFDMMKQYGIQFTAAGENIAEGQRTPAEVVNDWMNSEGHRANILNKDYTHIGVGYVENGNIWTQEFIQK